jgi:hypothetical protein
MCSLKVVQSSDILDLSVVGQAGMLAIPMQHLIPNGLCTASEMERILLLYYNHMFLWIQAWMGGNVFFQSKTGKCVKPPVQTNGQPCCTMKVWQPNYAGFYYDNCSAKCATPSW